MTSVDGLKNKREGGGDVKIFMFGDVMM